MSLSVESFLARPQSALLRRMTAACIDSALGIKKMSHMYYKFGLEHTHGEDFLAQVIKKLKIDLQGVEALKAAIPKTGPVVIAANHPFGGIEGVIMLHVITQVRPDVKVLANVALSLFPQMAQWSIFTNPLKPNNPKNMSSLRQCKAHLESAGALLVFPAGRVGYFRKDRQYIADHEWNRLVGRFVSQSGVKYCPVHISGQNSAWFYRMGRVWYRFRLLMLARELTNKHGVHIGLHSQRALDVSKATSAMSADEASEFCRALSYVQQPVSNLNWPATDDKALKPLLAPVSSDAILNEAQHLPKTQHLFTQGNLSAYFAQGEQIPHILQEITRCRELVFRMHDEGSGEPVDTDHFDYKYTHLFVVDTDAGRVAGAYRMGQTDRLGDLSNPDNLYLSRMFNFHSGFVNQQQPCLEMGRSFLMPEYQKSRLGLFMLWRAIGEFVVKHPQYHVLYGTVSLSKLYDKRSIKLIEKLAITPTDAVKPKHGFGFELQPEVSRYLLHNPVGGDPLPTLDTWLQAIEADGKKLPVLLRQYASLGAKFHCLGIDKQFADTPGLLLSVDLRNAPPKKLKQFLGDSWQTIASL